MTEKAEAAEATSRKEQERASTLVHGQVCYVQIPATDTNRSAGFYAAAFGWDVDAHHRDFTVPGSPVLIGQWVADRPPARDVGPLLWIHVADMSAALACVAEHGGKVIKPPAPDGPARVLATILDPAGNLMGLASHLRLSAPGRNLPGPGVVM